MEWEIVPFVGMGPINFGMSPAEVAAILGEPARVREKNLRRTELRLLTQPMIHYENNKVIQVEAFYEVEKVSLDGVMFFGRDGLRTLQELEHLNSGAKLSSTGTILFDKLGITTGRLDEDVRENHSVTAFAAGLWDSRLDRFKPVSFL